MKYARLAIGKVMADGNKLPRQFIQPTVIAEASAHILCATEETFVPFQNRTGNDGTNNTEGQDQQPRGAARVFR